MIALLKKDIYIIWKTIPYLPICIMVIGTVASFNQNNISLLIQAGLLTASMVEILLQLEEGCRWHVLQDTMPLSRARVVREKYVMLLCGAGAITCWQMLVNTVTMWLRSHHVEAGNAVFMPSIVFLSAMVFGSLMLPCEFRFGAVRGKQVYLFVLAAGMIGSLAISRTFRMPNHIPVHPAVLVLMMLGIGLLAGLLSYGIAVRGYRRRDLR